MLRFITFLLILLIPITFLFGVRIGKVIQNLDTAPQVSPTPQQQATSPKLIRYNIDSCDFQFAIPGNIIIQISSQSARLSYGKQQLTLECAEKNPSNNFIAHYQNSLTKKKLFVSGDKQLLKNMAPGFSNSFKEIINELNESNQSSYSDK